jgi:hypothetical protein
MKMITFLLVSMFVDTVLAVLTFADNGTCEKFRDHVSCEHIRNLDYVDTLCSWNDTAATCHYNSSPKSISFLLLAQSTATTLIAIPLVVVCSIMIGYIRDFVIVKYRKMSPRTFLTNPGGEVCSETDINGLQTLPCTLLRGARLTKMQSLMDNVSIHEESQNVLKWMRSTQRAYCMPEDHYLENRSIASYFWDQLLYHTKLSHLIQEDSTPESICANVELSRKQADWIANKLSAMDTEKERSKFL